MKGLKVARIFGINIELHISWIIIFLLIVGFVASGYLPLEAPDQPVLYYWAWGTIAALLFFASLLFHELSHSLIARRFGIAVEKITLFVLGGVALFKENPKSAKAEFFITVVGPLSSFVLAGFFWFLVIAGASSLPLLAIACFSYLALINAILAGFNLLPAFPMDGGRILRSILWRRFDNEAKATGIAAAIGKIFGFLMIVAGLSIVILTGNLSGLMWVLMGWFLWKLNAA